MSSENRGFAAAVQPVAQTIISTPVSGLDAGDVKIPAGDREIPAYCAKPAGKTNLPIVLVVHEIWALHEHFKDVCRRLAKAGYMAVACDLFARQGDPANLEIEEIRKIVAQVPDAQVMSDLDASAQWAARNGGDASRMAITGFCWGGRIVWLYAARSSTTRARGRVVWQGRSAGHAAVAPKHATDVAADLKVPVLGLYGGADAGIPNEGVDRMRAAIRAAGKPSEIHTYPDTPHAFYADYRPSYRGREADDGWQRMLEWFRRHGVA
jgi:carboxymethylenebutenolidase